MKQIKFAENLKSLRTSRDMTQDDLAKLLSVDQRTISNWENRICEPDLQSLLKLCEVFDETFENILL